VQLAQKPEAAQIESHREGTLLLLHQKSELLLTLQHGTMRAMRTSGLLLCLASAAAFGAMAPFGKLAYDAGATVGTLLSVRFVLAAALLWGLVLASGGGARAAVRALPTRDVVLALALGAGGYAIQAGCFFAALTRIDASLLSLLVFTFPAIVAVAAIALRRERAERRRLTALALASAGLALILAGAGAGAVDPVGAGLGLAAAVTYATYILVSEPVTARVDPRAFAALVCTGAAVPLTLGAALLGDLRPHDVSAAGWGWLAAIAVVCSVASISLFFAGLRRVGATTASILATLEPLVTVVLAALIFGERLTGPQLAGAAVMLGAVLVLTAQRAPRPQLEVAPCPQCPLAR
jgi:drug/metabolite transporter (DMT)-like permease